MNSLGIYFGTKDINIVETKGNKILNNIRLPHPKSEVSGLEELVPMEIKIMALLKDAFRSNHISASEATFCISGQDLVIRTFEIPLLPQSELKGAVSFEAKKYIPFKLDDLDYDFQLLFNQKNRTSSVLFVGIKKEILANYVSFASQLNLKINALEYSAFSVLRFLKLSGFSDSGVIATLCFDANNEDESSFTVFENGFSLFSRDFDFTGEPAGFEQVAESERIQKMDKLKNEIRTSFDYYNRKFPDKVVKNIFVISDKESYQVLQSFFAESSMPVRFVETQKVLGKTTNFSSILVKSFAASLFKSAPIKIKINLVSLKAKASRATVAKGSLFKGSLSSLFENVKFDLRYVFFGVIVCIAVFGYGLVRTQPMRHELELIKDKRMKITSASTTDDLGKLFTVSSDYSRSITALDNLVKNQSYVTPLLSAIIRALPRGIWLESIDFTQGKSISRELILNGGVHLEDSQQEFESVNIFLVNLKKDPIFSKYFKEFIIGSIDRKKVRDVDVAVFVITCKNFPEK